MPATAAAVQAAPPSALAGFLAAAELDDAALLSGLNLPSTHSGSPPVEGLLDVLQAERGTPVATLMTTGEQAEVVRAADAVSAARAALEAANGPAEAKQLRRVLAEARQDLAAARFELAVSELQRASSKDARHAQLTDKQTVAICEALNRRHAADVDEAFASVGAVQVIDADQRDRSVYQAATIRYDAGGEGASVEVEARVLDGGTAILRRGYGDFMVLQQKGAGGPYVPVAAASSKDAALAKAHRIPLVTMPPPPDDEGHLEGQAHAVTLDAVMSVAGRAAEGDTATLAAQQQAVGDAISQGRTQLVDRVGAEQFRAAVFEATRRHQRRLLEKTAAAAGQEAKAAVLAAHGTQAEAAAAAKLARWRALGTPTRGGGVVPHFDHRIPPQGLGDAKYNAAYRSGVRLFGLETAQDYQVVAKRAAGGDVEQWGFKMHAGSVTTSSIDHLTTQAAGFIKSLASHERSAITTYTGGSYRQINAAITGRDAEPAPHIKTVVTNLESAFDKRVKTHVGTEAMTLIRGTGVPSAWPGTRAEYLAQAFAPGSKVQVGKVTSFSTKTSTAYAFMQSNPYVMVVRTRDGLPVKSISSFASEDEVILPPGSDLRCVKVDTSGSVPTVYLVAEDLVAEAEAMAT